jgi:hypothetical protein
MPNWKKLLTSDSDASLNSLFVTNAVTASRFSGSFTGSLQGTASWANNATTASYILNAISASFASTTSYVNTLNQNVLIIGSLTIGTSSLGSNENTLVLGPSPAGGNGEGGQLLLQAPNSGSYTSASMLDNWQNYTRLLRGSNVSSDAVVTQWDMHSKQVSFPAYNSVSAFAGTAVANLAVDSGGNIITVSTSGGSVFPYTGVASINGGLIVTGSITASGAIHAQANGTMYFRGGDDAELWDINISNTIGIYGQQDQGVASIKLGSGGGTISGRSGSIGIGTINPNSASLHVSGNVFATSFTGSLLGTASFASTASYALNGNLNGSNTATAGTTTTILTIATGSYNAVFFDYAVLSGSNARAGTLTTIWSGSSIQYMDNSTTDIGLTNDVIMSATLSSGNVLLRATTTTYAWTVKTTYRLI